MTAEPSYSLTAEQRFVSRLDVGGKFIAERSIMCGELRFLKSENGTDPRQEDRVGKYDAAHMNHFK